MRAALLGLVVMAGCRSTSPEDRAGAAAELRGLGFPAKPLDAEQVRDVLARHHAVPDRWTRGGAEIEYTDAGPVERLWPPADPNAPAIAGGDTAGFAVWFDARAEITAARAQRIDAIGHWHDE